MQHPSIRFTLTLILLPMLLAGGFKGVGQSLERTRQMMDKSDTLRIQPIRIKKLDLNGVEVESLRQRSLAQAEKKEYRSALKGLYQVLNHYEKANLQVDQIQVLRDIARVYESWQVPERAIEYLQRAIIKIKSHQIENAPLFDILLKAGECNMEMGRQEVAEKNLKEALALVGQENDPMRKRQVLGLLSQVQMRQQKYSEVLEANLEIIRLEENRGPSPDLSYALNNTGFLYKQLGKPEKSIEFLNRAIEVENQLPLKDNRSIVSMRINLASTYNTQYRFNMAMMELIKALKLATQEKDPGLQAEIRNFLALIYFNTQDYPNAHFHAREAVRLAKRSGQSSIRISCFRSYGMILEKMGEFQEAYQYLETCLHLKDSLRMAEEANLKEQLARRSSVERTEKEIKLLLTDAEKAEFELQKMSLEAERKQKDLELLARQAELQQITYRAKELENERALQESRLQSQKLNSEKLMQQMALKQFEAALSADRLEKKESETRILLLEKEKKIQQNNLRIKQDQLIAQSNRERYFKSIGILIGLALASMLYGYIQIRMKNKALFQSQQELQLVNTHLGELNDEISIKSKSITESLNYARGIQEAILPDRTKWESLFPESFIFYQPKDIVSGDFYFLARHHSLVYLAFADCTGHGVPGALVSIVGHNLLSSCIEIQGMEDPAQILKEVHLGIRRTLKAETNGNRDSMELGLCILDPRQNRLSFASSMRSLMGIRNGEWFEWKGDRFSLGSDNEMKRPFTVFESSITEIEALYLTSDGYSDQLGGPEQKRFLSSRLRNLLFEIASLPMAEQGKKVKQTMDDWMQGERQLDDMMVIGLRPDLFRDWAV